MRRKLPESTPEYIEEGARWASIVNTNAHGILSRGGTGISIGLGLFPKIAILNHSCIPNASYEFTRVGAEAESDIVMSVRAIRAVEEGEEVREVYRRRICHRSWGE
mmetsp:Transcript_6775/g.26182  ORF Transcript_6775/g.26182 Transcript_6775/m.26182 type:complete len:106 (-) Transcript_6775:855-1172(-)